MKVTINFDIREFVPKSIYNAFGANSIWFVNPKIFEIAEFYKDFFTGYYKNLFPTVTDVLIVVNNWHYAGTKEFSGFRPPDYAGGGKLSQHRFGRAFDCEIQIVTKTKKFEADYKEIREVIKKNEALFFSKGVRAIENGTDGWLHTDMRPTKESFKILWVNP